MSGANQRKGKDQASLSVPERSDPKYDASSSASIRLKIIDIIPLK
jgi:hypothetical protein